MSARWMQLEECHFCSLAKENGNPRQLSGFLHEVEAQLTKVLLNGCHGRRLRTFLVVGAVLGFLITYKRSLLPSVINTLFGPSILDML
jgi:hypothetical protein